MVVHGMHMAIGIGRTFVIKLAETIADTRGLRQVPESVTIGRSQLAATFTVIVCLKMTPVESLACTVSLCVPAAKVTLVFNAELFWVTYFTLSTYSCM